MLAALFGCPRPAVVDLRAPPAARAGRVEAAVLPVRSAAELDATRALLVSGEARGWLALSAGEALGDDAAAVGPLIARGVTIVAPAGERTNAFADAAGDEPRHAGLSPRGVDLATRVLAAGALLDGAHASDPALFQMVALSAARRQPMLVTATASRALCDTPRNLSDEGARAVAETGGLVGVLVDAPLLVCGEREATVADLADHIVHFVGVVGPFGVALGTDFEGARRLPAGLSDRSDLPRVAHELERRGLQAWEIVAIFGGNAERVLGEPPLYR